MLQEQPDSRSDGKSIWALTYLHWQSQPYNKLVRLTLFPAPPTLMTSWGSMASTQSVTTLLLWERVVVTMRLSPGTSFTSIPNVPSPSTPHMVLPRSAPPPT